MKSELTFDTKDMVTAITEEGQEYLFEFSGFAPQKTEQAVLERFLGERAEIDEILKETERKLEEKYFEEPMKGSMSLEEFKKHMRDMLSKLNKAGETDDI